MGTILITNMKFKRLSFVHFFLLIFTQFSFTVEKLPQFITPISSGLKKPITIYNNWSAYDELSDNIPQTEELCMKMLNEVIRLKNQGVQIDCYLMDAFWFDVEGGYRIWHKKNWPDGPDRWLKKCKENDIIPGLWFSTNLIEAGGTPMLHFIPEWEGSQTSDKTVVSLFEGGYLTHLIEMLQLYTDMGFGVFKFDFAHFDACTDDAKRTMLSSEIEASNKQAFMQAVKKFRAKNPQIIFIGYNGFGGEMENTTAPFRKTVDLRWLEIFDTLYSGDPRFSDVPMINIWRSQDLYSDHMVQQFAFNGLPLSRIDNCSFMTGKTGTCYKRGISAWKSSLILNMARGGWLNVYHGNIDLLNDEDAQWFAKVQNTYLQLQQFGQTSVIGGIPGRAEVYGYQSMTTDGCLFTIVNPSQVIREIELPAVSCSKGRILFTDKGFVPILNENKIMLGAEQMAVIGFGKFNSTAYDWGIENDVVIPQAIEKMNVTVQIMDKNSAKVQLTDIKDKIRILFSQMDGDGIPFRSWGGAPPDGIKMDEFLKITAMQGKKEVLVNINYDKMIWSGLSWASGEIETVNLDPKIPLTITCRSKEGESKNFKIEVFHVKFETKI